MTAHKKWIAGDFAQLIEEHNSLYDAVEHERKRSRELYDRVVALTQECERLENKMKLELELNAQIKEPQPPTADTHTLEDLAKIGRKELDIASVVEWGELPAITQNNYLRQTAAILRAARPVLNVTAEEVRQKRRALEGRSSTSSRVDIEDLLAWLNTRIRYRVEPTPAECPTCAKVRAALEGER